MPRKTGWIHQIPDALAELEQLPSPVVDRATVERLLGVSPRQALRILGKLGSFRAGRNLLANRRELAEALRQYAERPEVASETRRRERVESQLIRLRGELRARRVPVPVRADVWERRFGDLPVGIELQAGELRIRFGTAEDLLRKLLELSQAIANDYSRFEELAQGHLG